MKKYLVLFLSLFLLVGCGTASPHTVTSVDPNIFEVTVPGSWVQADRHSLNENANLEALDANQDAYFMAIMEDKANFNGFDGYKQAAVTVINQSYNVDLNTLTPEEVTINGNPAYLYTFDVPFEGIVVYMQVYIIQTENYFGTLYAWTVEANKDAQTSILRDIALSFIEKTN